MKLIRFKIEGEKKNIFYFGERYRGIEIKYSRNTDDTLKNLNRSRDSKIKSRKLYLCIFLSLISEIHDK